MNFYAAVGLVSGFLCGFVWLAAWLGGKQDSDMRDVSCSNRGAELLPAESTWFIQPKHPTAEVAYQQQDFDKLVRLAQKMIDESGNPEGFDASAWLANWMQRRVPALGGRTPASYMNSTSGRKTVATLLRQMQWGAYA
ncbi:MAG: MbcA/ParS/Xre antitoxin family protein [Rhodanobacter sp.]